MGVTVTVTSTLLVACTNLTRRLVCKKLPPDNVKVDAEVAYSVPEILLIDGSAGEKPLQFKSFA